MTSIDDEAFYGCDLSVVISKIENPFVIGTDVFSNNTFLNGTLYVPAGTIDTYKATDGWKNFMSIEEGLPLGVPDVRNDNVDAIRRYAIDGNVLTKTHKGISIIKTNNGITKKVMKK